MWSGHGHVHTSVDLLVSDTPVILHGVVLSAGGDNADVELYNGQDAASGQLIIHVKAVSGLTFSTDLFGVRCERGLFVNVGANVEHVLVVYDPIPVGESQPGAGA